MWANVLVERAVTTGTHRLYHCNCHPGGENLLNMNASFNLNTKKVRNIGGEDYISNATS